MPVICGTCGVPATNESAIFCDSCGAKLSSAAADAFPTIACPHCNAANDPRAVFCPECGEALPPDAPPGGRKPFFLIAFGTGGAVGAAGMGLAGAASETAGSAAAAPTTLAGMGQAPATSGALSGMGEAGAGGAGHEALAGMGGGGPAPTQVDAPPQPQPPTLAPNPPVAAVSPPEPTVPAAGPPQVTETTPSVAPNPSPPPASPPPLAAPPAMPAPAAGGLLGGVGGITTIVIVIIGVIVGGGLVGAILVAVGVIGGGGSSPAANPDKSRAVASQPAISAGSTPNTTPAPTTVAKPPQSGPIDFNPLPIGDVSLVPFGFTIIPNPTNLGLTTPPGTGTFNIVAVGTNQVFPVGTTKLGYFLGPLTTIAQFNTVNCTTLSYTGGGSLMSFAVTRIGVSGGGSGPAWQVTAYDASSTQVGRMGEGDFAAGGFYFPATFETFTLNATSPISFLVICTHNKSSTYGAVILTGISRTAR